MGTSIITSGSRLEARRWRFHYARHLIKTAALVMRRTRQRVNARRIQRALAASRGVIHVGANTGQERHHYDRHGLPVFWVEPIPTVFEALKRNTADFLRQRCANALVADVDGREVILHVASNEGASSSILDLAEHRALWPDIHYVADLRLTSVTLPTLLKSEGLDVARYDVLVLDTQGSELLILQGADSLLRRFSLIQVEVSDFESYVGCAKRAEVTAFLEAFGFREWIGQPFSENAGGRHYYDVIYRNRRAWTGV